MVLFWTKGYKTVIKKLLNLKKKYHILIGLAIFILGCKDYKRDKALEVIKKIEAFKIINKRFPKNSKEINLEEIETSPIFYELVNDSIYKVWYGIDLGTSAIYNSGTKQWSTQY